ncbi:hypothetical protein SAMN05443428_11079 [Caloramator quimbayensis]|uniref:Uncharacterized protein n=1 Tax=Caloramator quimbayensis TaxID=1147123 RepID=A0A1T4XN14_9CLOT|nr:hypothetical protein SAMN05443428_11079 [Caloramator quimbayensis]
MYKKQIFIISKEVIEQCLEESIEKIESRKKISPVKNK